jgi:hypothetical protein
MQWSSTTVNIPQADRLVTRPTDELRWIRRVEMDATDIFAAIVSNVSFALRLSPAERGTERKVPVAFQRRLARARCHVPYLEGVVGRS